MRQRTSRGSHPVYRFSFNPSSCRMSVPLPYGNGRGTATRREAQGAQAGTTFQLESSLKLMGESQVLPIPEAIHASEVAWRR
jgi:hypothetical protein